jgi:hypothetical protein
MPWAGGIVHRLGTVDAQIELGPVQMEEELALKLVIGLEGLHSVDAIADPKLGTGASHSSVVVVEDKALAPSPNSHGGL